MAAQALSWHSRILVQRHVPSAPVSILKNCAFELMTRAASIARRPAAPEQPAIYRDARRIRPFVGPSPSTMRPRTATVPAWRPEHKVCIVFERRAWPWSSRETWASEPLPAAQLSDLPPRPTTRRPRRLWEPLRAITPLAD